MRLTEFLKSRSEKQLIWTLFLVSLIIRLTFAIVSYYSMGTSNFDDDWVYDNIAREMLKQGVWLPDISHFDWREVAIGPGFPLIIFICYKLFGINYLIPMIANAIASASLTVIIYYTARLVFDKKIAIVSAIWSLFYVYYIRWVPSLLKENWVQFFFALSILFLFQVIAQKHYLKYLILLSLVYTLLIHTDERYLMFAPVFFVGILLLDKYCNESLSFVSGLKKSFVFTLLVCLFSLPWFIRNYSVYHKPVLLTQRTAFVVDKIFGYSSSYNYPQEIEVSDATIDSVIKGYEIYDRTIEKELKRVMKYGIYPRRFSFIEKVISSFKEFWIAFRVKPSFTIEGFRAQEPWSLKHNLSVMLTYGILLPFMLIGFFLGLKKKDKLLWFLFIVICFQTFIHLFIVLSNYRYRTPIDFIVITVAFYGLFEIIKIIKVRLHKAT
ncbi:MAG: ArnT family glycosyltransferase [Ignavibacteria bacterium]